MKKAREIMTENPSTCLPTDSIYNVVKQMELNNCGAVPITDQNGRCIGIVTDRDICLFLGLCESAINPKELNVSEVMTEDLVTCNPEDNLDTVIRLMEENQIRRIPVVNQQGRCVGIIAQADIALAADGQQRVTQMVQEISK